MNIRGGRLLVQSRVILHQDAVHQVFVLRPQAGVFRARCQYLFVGAHALQRQRLPSWVAAQPTFATLILCCIPGSLCQALPGIAFAGIGLNRLARLQQIHPGLRIHDIDAQVIVPGGLQVRKMPGDLLAVNLPARGGIVIPVNQVLRIDIVRQR